MVCATIPRKWEEMGGKDKLGPEWISGSTFNYNPAHIRSPLENCHIKPIFEIFLPSSESPRASAMFILPLTSRNRVVREFCVCPCICLMVRRHSRFFRQSILALLNLISGLTVGTVISFSFHIGSSGHQLVDVVEHGGSLLAVLEDGTHQGGHFRAAEGGEVPHGQVFCYGRE